MLQMKKLNVDYLQMWKQTELFLHFKWNNIPIKIF